jgi:phenolic acid decarboxylase
MVMNHWIPYQQEISYSIVWLLLSKYPIAWSKFPCADIMYIFQANNMVIFGIVNYYEDWLKSLSHIKVTNEKPHIITTNVEHDSVILPIKYLEKKGAIGKLRNKFMLK